MFCCAWIRKFVTVGVFSVFFTWFGNICNSLGFKCFIVRGLGIFVKVFCFQYFVLRALELI